MFWVKIKMLNAPITDFVTINLNVGLLKLLTHSTYMLIRSGEDGLSRPPKMFLKKKQLQIMSRCTKSCLLKFVKCSYMLYLR